MFVITSFLAAQALSPTLKIKTSGAITDFLIEDSKVILSTDAGTIETYNLKTGQKTDFIQLPEMKDFMGDPVPTKVYSIDKVKDKLLVVTQGNHGFRNVFIMQGKNQTKIIDAGINKMLVKKARFINDDQVLLGLMSNDLILFNILEKGFNYSLSISPYTFSDFSLDVDKAFVFTSDESGVVHKIDVQKGLVVEEYSGNNVDNVYKLVYKNGTIITAGQDRRVGVYNTITGDDYYLQKDFLVYSVGLNADGSIGAYSATEDNKISIFKIASRDESCVLTGHESVVTKMAFFDDHTFLSAGDDQYLMIWKIE